jgi:hypothetical protein
MAPDELWARFVGQMIYGSGRSGHANLPVAEDLEN